MTLDQFISKPQSSFEQLFSEEVKHFKMPIDCSKFETPNFKSDQKNFIDIITQLNVFKKPCLYWFEADDRAAAKHFISSLDAFRAGQELDTHRRIVPTVNMNLRSGVDTQVLYVGKRNGGYRKKDGLSNIAGRINIHLGYYKVGTTQGLQLAHWSKHKINLNVLELPDHAAEYLPVLEKLLAQKLKPLCGRH